MPHRNKILPIYAYELSPPHTSPRQKPFFKYLRTIIATGFFKIKKLSKISVNYHHQIFYQDKKLTTSIYELSSLRILPRQKHLTTSIYELSPPHLLAKQKPYQKHLRTIAATHVAKIKDLPQAPTNYHHNAFCQNKKLTRKTYKLSPLRMLPRQKPCHKYLRIIHAKRFTKTKILPQAPTKYLRYVLCKKSFIQAPANYRRHVICQDKILTPSTCELSPPRVLPRLPRQKPSHKHLRTIAATQSAKTKT